MRFSCTATSSQAVLASPAQCLAPLQCGLHGGVVHVSVKSLELLLAMSYPGCCFLFVRPDLILVGVLYIRFCEFYKTQRTQMFVNAMPDETQVQYEPKTTARVAAARRRSLSTWVGGRPTA